MQRRAVAVYVAFFVLIAAASYTLIATAEEPTITLEDPDHELSEGESFTVGGQEYTITGIEETEDEDDGTMTFAGTIEWVEEDVEQSEMWEDGDTVAIGGTVSSMGEEIEVTETWADGETVEVDGTNWEVQIDDEDDPTSFTLVEVLDQQAILDDDPNATEIVEEDGEEFVIVEEDGEEEQVEADEYFDPETVSYSEGDLFRYNDQTFMVTDVTPDDVTISWAWEVELDDEAEEPTSFTLVEVIDREAILEDDPDAQNETTEVDGIESVIVDNQTIPAEEYFDEPVTVTYSEGDSFTYNNQNVTVFEVTPDDVTLTWIADETRTEDLEQGGMIELADGNEYLTFFPGSNTVMFTQDTTSYDQQVESQEEFADRVTGLTYTIVTSLLFVFSLIAFAFLPSRY